MEEAKEGNSEGAEEAAVESSSKYRKGKEPERLTLLEEHLRELQDKIDLLGDPQHIRNTVYEPTLAQVSEHAGICIICGSVLKSVSHLF